MGDNETPSEISVATGEEQQGQSTKGLMECSFPNCKKKFNSCWSLTRHIRTHTGDKPFKCEAEGCGKEFVEKCALRRHEQTHSDKKQWTCPVPKCGKKFKLKEYLDVHRRTHLKESISPDCVTNAPDDSGNAADNSARDSILVDQLRQRLMRNNVRHSDEIARYQRDNERLKGYLKECGFALEMAVNSMQSQNSNNSVPSSLKDILSKITRVNEYFAQCGPSPSFIPDEYDMNDTDRGDKLESMFSVNQPSHRSQQASMPYMNNMYPHRPIGFVPNSSLYQNDISKFTHLPSFRSEYNLNSFPPSNSMPYGLPSGRNPGTMHEASLSSVGMHPHLKRPLSQMLDEDPMLSHQAYRLPMSMATKQASSGPNGGGMLSSMNPSYESDMNSHLAASLYERDPRKMMRVGPTYPKPNAYQQGPNGPHSVSNPMPSDMSSMGPSSGYDYDGSNFGRRYPIVIPDGTGGGGGGGVGSIMGKVTPSEYLKLPNRSATILAHHQREDKQHTTVPSALTGNNNNNNNNNNSNPSTTADKNEIQISAMEALALAASMFSNAVAKGNE